MLYLSISDDADCAVVATSDPGVIRAALEAISTLDTRDAAQRGLHLAGAGREESPDAVS